MADVLSNYKKYELNLLNTSCDEL